MSRTKPTFLVLSALIPALSFALGACATAPKPAALTAYEELHRSANVEPTRKRFPALVANAEQYGQRATQEWDSGDLDESTRAALMAQIKLKTALARYEQEHAKARVQQLSTEQAQADAVLADVTKDLNAVTEQIALMERLAETRRASEAMTSEQQAERQQLSDQLATEKKRAEAQLALRTADTVEASKHAASEYGAAASMLAKAEAEIRQKNWGAAQASLEVAKRNADKATEIAKPIYEREAEATQNKVRDEALARDAAMIAGVSVRIERRGDLQRLVITVTDLFARMKTTITPGQDSALDPIAKLIAKYPTYPIQILGHTDNRGRAGELLALSQARAQTVFSALVARGVEPRRMMVSGQGPNEPIADNKSSAGRQKNNRIEIVFLYH